MKKFLSLVFVAAAFAAFAKPMPMHFQHRHGPLRHMPAPRHIHHPHVSPWTGFAVGTIVGAAIATSPVVQQPIVTTTVVQQPVKVWVPAHHENQLQPNGIVVRVYVPGHWETR